MKVRGMPMFVSATISTDSGACRSRDRKAAWLATAAMRTTIALMSTFYRFQFTRVLLFCAAIALSLDHGRGALAADTHPDPSSLPAPKRVVVPKLAGKISLDGDLNESVWKKAALLTPLFRNDRSGPEREKTEVRLWYDDN